MMRLATLFCIACLLLAFTAGKAFAQPKLTASLSSAEIALGDSVVLHLTLEGARTTPSLDLSPLEQDFRMTGRSQTSNVDITGGTARVHLGWDIGLMPQREGKLRVPPLAVRVDGATLTTPELDLVVSAASRAVQRKETYAGEVSIRTESGQANPYVREPFLFSVIVAVGGEVIDTEMGQLEADGARVDMAGKPETREYFREGRRILETRFDYLVTPLRETDVTLHPVALTGKILAEKGAAKGSALESLSDRFGLPGLIKARYYEPFTTFSREEVIPVRPARPDIWPWLPLSELTVTTEPSSAPPEALQPGEPVTRTVTMTAHGNYDTALPDILALYEAALSGSGIRVYGAKPEAESRYDKASGQLQATHRQALTLIPERGGRLNVPDIAIAWWQLDAEQARTTLITGFTLNVAGALPHDATPPPAGEKEYQTGAEDSAPDIAAQAAARTFSGDAAWEHAPAMPPLWTFLAPTLSLAAGLSWLVWRVRHRRRAASDSLPPARIAMMQAADAHTLWQAARRYLSQRGGMEKMPSLIAMARRLDLSADRPEQEELLDWCHRLEAAAFGRKPEDFDTWKVSFIRVADAALTTRKKYPSSAKPVRVKAALPPLNPAIGGVSR